MTIELLGRSHTCECIALPEGAHALLGCVPMEMMGIEPDLRNRTVRLLPETGPDTYWLVY